ncbi:MAG: Gfo/Idh/MocA family protein [Thermomicrobiales bacterium]
MARDLKAGVIGAGIMGASHAREFNANKNTELVAIADLDRGKAAEIAEKEHAKAYFSADDMLQQEDLDVVYIATPDPYHLQPLRAALDAGIKNILLQKPFATSVEDAQAMADAIDAKGANVYVTYGTRSRTESAAGKFLTESGLIGDPLFASMRNVDNISVPREMWADRPDNWAAKSSSVPFLYSHRIDRLRWYYQPAEVETVSAVSRSEVLGYSTDFYESILTWTNGLVTRVHTGWVDFGSLLVYCENIFHGARGMITHNETPAFGRPTPGFQVMFDDIEFDELRKAQDELLSRGIGTRLFWEKPDTSGIPKTVAGLEVVPKANQKALTDYIVDAFLENTPCPTSWKNFQGSSSLPTYKDGLEQTRVCCAVEESARTGKVIRLR